MSDYTGKFTDKKGNDSCFERDKDAFDKAAEGDGETKKQPDWAGGRTARKPTADPGLKYTNSGEDND